MVRKWRLKLVNGRVYIVKCTKDERAKLRELIGEHLIDYFVPYITK